MTPIAKPLISFVLLLFVAASARASDYGSAKGAVGFSGGGVIGTGLTYRLYLSRSFLQGTFFGRVTRQDDITDLMAGVSYGHVLSEITLVKVLPPTALVFVGGVDGRYSEFPHTEGVTSEDPGFEKSMRAGAGIALEIGNTFSPGLLVSVGTTYALAMEQLNGSWEWSLGPQMNLGLLYNW